MRHKLVSTKLVITKSVAPVFKLVDTPKELSLPPEALTGDELFKAILFLENLPSTCADSQPFTVKNLNHANFKQRCVAYTNRTWYVPLQTLPP